MKGFHLKHVITYIVLQFFQRLPVSLALRDKVYATSLDALCVVFYDFLGFHVGVYYVSIDTQFDLTCRKRLDFSV